MDLILTLRGYGDVVNEDWYNEADSVLFLDIDGWVRLYLGEPDRFKL